MRSARSALAPDSCVERLRAVASRIETSIAEANPAQTKALLQLPIVELRVNSKADTQRTYRVLTPDRCKPCRRRRASVGPRLVARQPLPHNHSMDASVLEYDVIGGGGPPIVLLPGGLTGWQSWLPLLPALSAERQVVSMQPIANAAGIAGQLGDASYGAHVERESARMTLDEVGIETMHLVGWSNGGRMALDFALAYPNRVQTLTVIEPAAWWLVSDRCDEARHFEDFVLGCAGREITEHDVRQFLIRVALGNADTAFAALPAWPTWLACRNVLSWYGPHMISTAKEGLEGFERLAAPLLLIRGQSTAPWLSEVVDELRDGVRRAKIVELAGGHACILENPAPFVSALLAHITDS